MTMKALGEREDVTRKGRAEAVPRKARPRMVADQRLRSCRRRDSRSLAPPMNWSTSGSSVAASCARSVATDGAAVATEEESAFVCGCLTRARRALTLVRGIQIPRRGDGAFHGSPETQTCGPIQGNICGGGHLGGTSRISFHPCDLRRSRGSCVERSGGERRSARQFARQQLSQPRHSGLCALERSSELLPRPERRVRERIERLVAQR